MSFQLKFFQNLQFGLQERSTSVIWKGPIWQRCYHFFRRVVIRRNVGHTKAVRCVTDPLPVYWHRNSVRQNVRALLLWTISEVGIQYKIEKSNQRVVNQCTLKQVFKKVRKLAQLVVHWPIVGFVFLVTKQYENFNHSRQYTCISQNSERNSMFHRNCGQR